MKILEQHNFKRGNEGAGSSSDGDEEDNDAPSSPKRRKVMDIVCGNGYNPIINNLL